EALVGHHLRGERARNGQPPVHHRLTFRPDRLELVLPHGALPRFDVNVEPLSTAPSQISRLAAVGQGERIEEDGSGAKTRRATECAARREIRPRATEAQSRAAAGSQAGAPDAPPPRARRESASGPPATPSR